MPVHDKVYASLWFLWAELIWSMLPMSMELDEIVGSSILIKLNEFVAEARQNGPIVQESWEITRIIEIIDQGFWFAVWHQIFSLLKLEVVRVFVAEHSYKLVLTSDIDRLFDDSVLKICSHFFLYILWSQNPFYDLWLTLMQVNDFTFDDQGYLIDEDLFIITKIFGNPLFIFIMNIKLAWGLKLVTFWVQLVDQNVAGFVDDQETVVILKLLKC